MAIALAVLQAITDRLGAGADQGAHHTLERPESPRAT